MRSQTRQRRPKTTTTPVSAAKSDLRSSPTISPMAMRTPTSLQPKLMVNSPGDRYEQEADRVADQVMRMPEPGVQRLCTECEADLQRQPLAEEEEEDLLQMKPIAGTISPLVQRQTEPIEEEAADEEEFLQAKAAAGEPATVSSGLQNQIMALQGGGQPLSPSERHFFEPRFGTDFSQVRIHTDGQATEAASAVNARAFTLGQDVVFGSGEYQQGSSEGRRLLAHELTHVVQQTQPSTVKLSDRPAIQRQLSTEDDLKDLNHSADQDQVYASQMANAPLRSISKGAIIPGVTCNITSLSMQLTQLMGGQDLLAEHLDSILKYLKIESDLSQTNAYKLNEIGRHLINEEESTFKRLLRKVNPNLNEQKTEDLFSKVKGRHNWLIYHDAMHALAEFVLTFIWGKTSYESYWLGKRIKNITIEKIKKYYLDRVKPRIQQGEIIRLGTKLTGAHVVFLKDVKDDGLVVHDPYGMRLSRGYILNGGRRKSWFHIRLIGKNPRFKNAKIEIERRLKYNPRLLEQLKTEEGGEEMLQTYGQSVFFNWEEVMSYQMFGIRSISASVIVSATYDHSWTFT